MVHDQLMVMISEETVAAEVSICSCSLGNGDGAVLKAFRNEAQGAWSKVFVHQQLEGEF